MEDRPYLKEGKRLKAEYYRYKKEHKGYTQQKAADIINVSVPCFSNYCRGTRKPTPGDYKKIAAAWGIRAEYLMCIDNFRTDAQMRRDNNDERIAIMYAHTHYLEVLGYSVSTMLTFHVIALDVLPEIWHDLQPTLTDDTLALAFRNGLTLKEWDGTGIETLLEQEKETSRIYNVFHGAGLPVKDTIINSNDRSGVVVMNRTHERIGFYDLKYIVMKDDWNGVYGEDAFEYLLEQIARHIDVVLKCSHTDYHLQRRTIPEQL